MCDNMVLFSVYHYFTSVDLLKVCGVTVNVAAANDTDADIFSADAAHVEQYLYGRFIIIPRVKRF